MKKTITILIILSMIIQLCSIITISANEDIVNLKTLTINNGEFDFHFRPEQQTYFEYNIRYLEEVTLSVEPINENDKIYFGLITHNKSEFYDNDTQELSYTYNLNLSTSPTAPSSSETRLLIKVISANSMNEKIYSIIPDLGMSKGIGGFVGGGKGLTVSAAGIDTALLSQERENISLACSSIIPSEDILTTMQDLISDNEMVAYIDIFAYNKRTSEKLPYDEAKLLHTRFDIFESLIGGGYAPPIGWGKDFKAYTIADGKFNSISIGGSSTTPVYFETDKLGILAIVYNPEIFTVSFYDDWSYDSDIWNEFYSIENLKLNDLVTLPPTNPTKSGYTFVGWYLFSMEGAEERPWTTETIIRDGLTYVAYWEKKAPSSNSSSSSGTRVNEPTANVESGTINAGSSIVLTSQYPNGKIYYTTDGKSPTINSNLYSTPIIIDKTTTIKFMVVNNGFSSNVTTNTYTIAEPDITIKENANQIRFIKGYQNNTFNPDKSITRYEMLDSLINFINIKNTDSDKIFFDVPTEKAELVSLFTGIGIIDGYEDDTFKGDEGLTRAEFVKIMSLILDVGIDNQPSKYIDVMGHWAEKYIAVFEDLEYIEGYGENLFKPDNKISRVEFATILSRIFKTDNTVIENTYTDLEPTHWGYDIILKSCIK